MTRPSEIRIPVGYPNDDPANGAGMSQRDFDEGQIGGDSLRIVAELRQMDTFGFLEPEFQRAYIALAVAAWVEAGLLLGVGTGWRSEAVQAANHARWPKQFAPVSASLHMRKPPLNVAYAIDSVPYDALGWAHANCARFGINYLDHIPNERHHCQPGVLPNSGSAYNLDPERYSALAAVRVNLPYLGLLSLDEWLAADAPIELVPDPVPEPPPTPEPSDEEDDVKLYIGRDLRDGQILISIGGVCFRRVRDGADENGVKARLNAGVGPTYYDPRRADEQVVDFDAIPDLDGAWVVAMGVELAESKG